MASEHNSGAIHPPTRLSWLFVAALPFLLAADPAVKNKVIMTGAVTVSVKGETVPITDATVYLGPTDAATPDEKPPAVTVQAKDGQIEPKHVAVMVGQKLVVELGRGGPYAITFNAPAEPQFGETLPAPSDKFEKVFAKPAASVTIRCSINPKLIGYVTVTPNRYMTHTDKEGAFTLPAELPTGKYTLHAFHTAYGSATCEFEVGPSDKKIEVKLKCKERK